MREFLQEAAWRFLLAERIEELPVRPSKIIARHGWLLYTYREFCDITGYTMAELIQRHDREGFVFWSNRRETYVVCYNQAFTPSTIRWTLMHEIAHVVLGHVAPGLPAPSRIRSDQRNLFELEAQGFARRVLCPSIVLHDCNAFEPRQIMALCGVSYEAARYRSDYIKKLERRGKFLAHHLEQEVERQFRQFVMKYLAESMDYEISEEICQEFLISA